MGHLNHKSTGFWVGTFVFTVALSLATRSSAQDAQQQRAAADAYDRGSAAYLAEDYETAARWFETANRLAPAAPALLQAVRAHRLGGNGPRAATLAALLLVEYEGTVATEAQSVIDELGPQYVRVDVTCDSCALSVDGSVAPHTSIFVTPEEPHQLVMGFATGDVEREVQGTAGETLTLSAEAPPPTSGGPSGRLETGTVDTGGNNTITVGQEEERGGISPAWFVTSLVLTVGAGATLIWSGIDVQNDADTYEQVVRSGDLDRARVLLDEGQKEETRTNILIGTTAALGVLTVALAIATDWGGDGDEDEATLRPSVGVSDEGAAIALEGRF